MTLEEMKACKVCERVQDIAEKAKDEIVCVLSELIDSRRGNFRFDKGTTLVTPQLSLVFPVRLYRADEDYLFEYATENGDCESRYLYDMELSMLIKVAEEIYHAQQNF